MKIFVCERCDVKVDAELAWHYDKKCPKGGRFKRVIVDIYPESLVTFDTRRSVFPQEKGYAGKAPENMSTDCGSLDTAQAR